MAILKRRVSFNSLPCEDSRLSLSSLHDGKGGMWEAVYGSFFIVALWGIEPPPTVRFVFVAPPYRWVCLKVKAAPL